uniref:Uncharacterized protein n=1 Tax=Electrophorus electricus TaxID=8005 RepID=A0AAY5F254_ELEEL
MTVHPFTWLSALLLVSRVWAMPTNCRFRRGLVEICHSLLISMGGRFPLRCIDDHVLVPFPKTAFEYNTRQQAGAIKQSIYVTLKHIYSVFDNDEVPEQWSVQEKFEDFQNILYRQTEENECKHFCFPSQFQRETALRVYFEKLRTILKEKDFQYCAWEFVRDEVQHILLFILKTDFDGWFSRRG